MKWQKTTLITAGFLLLLYQLFKSKNMFSKITNLNKIRPCDPFGCGSFGAKRATHIHQGIDLLVNENEPIFAPFDGVVLRFAIPYKDDNKYKGLLLKNGNFEVKIFYFLPIVNKGEKIKKGQIIGFAQNIAKKYSSKMQNHVHVEVAENGITINPTNLFL